MDELEQIGLDTSLVEPRTVPVAGSDTDATPEQPRERRKRRTKAEMEALRAYEDANPSPAGEATVAAPAKRSSRRSPGKLSADDVVQGMTIAFAGVAMLTRQQHWMLDPDEVKPWAREAADLLNRIPSKYVRAAVDLSGYVIVGTGLYGCAAPRIAASQQLAAEKRAARLARNQQEAVTEAEQHLAGVPW